MPSFRLQLVSRRARAQAKMVDVFPDANKAPAFFAPHEPSFCLYFRVNEQSSSPSCSVFFECVAHARRCSFTHFYREEDHGNETHYPES